MGIGPDIHAVKIHENRDIASHPNAALRAIPPQSTPLLVKSELDRPAHVEIVAQFLAGCIQRSRLPPDDLPRPLVPALQVRAGAQRVKQYKIFQPPVVLGTKRFKPGSRLSGGGRDKIARGDRQ